MTSHTFSFFLMLLRFSLFLWNSLFCIITFSVKSFMISLELLSSGFATWTTFCKLRQTNFTGSARRSLSASEHMRPSVTAGINCNRKTMLHMVGFLQSKNYAAYGWLFANSDSTSNWYLHNCVMLIMYCTLKFTFLNIAPRCLAPSVVILILLLEKCVR